MGIRCLQSLGRPSRRRRPGKPTTTVSSVPVGYLAIGLCGSCSVCVCGEAARTKAPDMLWGLCAATRSCPNRAPPPSPLRSDLPCSAGSVSGCPASSLSWRVPEAPERASDGCPARATGRRKCDGDRGSRCGVGLVAEIRGCVSGCAHLLEKSAPGFKKVGSLCLRTILVTVAVTIRRR